MVQTGTDVMALAIDLSDHQAQALAEAAARLQVSEADLAAEAGRLLDSEIKPFQAQVAKPVILSLAYPSAKGASSGCLPAPQGDCLSLEALARRDPDLESLQGDEAFQSAIEAGSRAAAARPRPTR